MGPRSLLDRWNPVIREAAAKFNIPAMWLRAVRYIVQKRLFPEGASQ